MGIYDTQQVCLNGHQITECYNRYPQHRKDYCEKCGAQTIFKCPGCSTEIKGDYHVDGVIGSSRTNVPDFCEKCGKPFPWFGKVNLASATGTDPMVLIGMICKRFPFVVDQLKVRRQNRPPFIINDEYDMQDLLHSLLWLHFDDVRHEEYTPSIGGTSSRMDFLLSEDSIVLEAKMTRKGLGNREVSDQLLVDIARYKNHPNCKLLFCFVYDPKKIIVNPRGLEKDLTKTSNDLAVKVHIVS